MIEVNLNNIKSHLKLGLIHINMVYPIRKDAHFRVDAPIKVTLSNDAVIYIEKNFEFDGSSSPKFLWWLFPSYGNFFFAALVHDFLYVKQYMKEEIGVKEAQKFADNEMLAWSNKLNNNKLDNLLRFWAVRLFGKKVYKK